MVRKPSVDATALAKNGDKDTETVFCAYYVAVLKKRQVSSAFTGAAVWLLILLVVVAIAVG